MTMDGDSTFRSLQRKYLLFCVLLLATTGCRTMERWIVYNPPKYPQNWAQPTEGELAGLSFQDVCFRSSDGTRLNGWLIQPNCSDSSNAILFTHGRGRNLGALKSDLIKFVRFHQVPVFVFDYRGFGKSDGQPDEAGLYRDATAARDWLAHHTGLAPHDIIIMGRSLGAPVAIDLAARDGAKALILENGLVSIPDVVCHHTHGLISGKRIIDARFNSKCKIGCYAGPVFISHGKADKTIPFSHGVKLAKSATSASRVHFMELDGGHQNPQPEYYHASLQDFLKSL